MLGFGLKWKTTGGGISHVSTVTRLRGSLVIIPHPFIPSSFHSFILPIIFPFTKEWSTTQVNRVRYRRKPPVLLAIPSNTYTTIICHYGATSILLVMLRCNLWWLWCHYKISYNIHKVFYIILTKISKVHCQKRTYLQACSACVPT